MLLSGLTRRQLLAWTLELSSTPGQDRGPQPLRAQEPQEEIPGRCQKLTTAPSCSQPPPAIGVVWSGGLSTDAAEGGSRGWLCLWPSAEDRPGRTGVSLSLAAQAQDPGQSPPSPQRSWGPRNQSQGCCCPCMVTLNLACSLPVASTPSTVAAGAHFTKLSAKRAVPGEIALYEVKIIPLGRILLGILLSASLLSPLAPSSATPSPCPSSLSGHPLFIFLKSLTFGVPT